uniref:Interleukin n=1 Tax=Cyprinodon variegatus TaxID=28743 RepID=A0A3Q2CBR2_CYPVA
MAVLLVCRFYGYSALFFSASQESDAMLYTPSSNYTVNKVLECYMLELMMIIMEEGLNRTEFDCFRYFKNKLLPKPNCPECETYPLKNTSTFFATLETILQKISKNTHEW